MPDSITFYFECAGLKIRGHLLYRMLTVLFVFHLVLMHGWSQDYTVILGRPTHQTITASVIFNQKVNYYIEYGGVSGLFPFKTSEFVSVAFEPNEIEIKGLEANTKYYYRLRFRSNGNSTYSTSAEYSFHTQRARGMPYTFVIEADEHLYDKKGVKRMYEITLENQLKDNPDFMFSLGDTFGDDHTPEETTSEDMKQLHLDYIPLLSKICHSVPFFFCLGNHEGENGYYLKQNEGENIAVYGTKWRKYYYPNPFPNEFYSGNMKIEGYEIGQPENYYSFDWGDATFIVLDVYRDCDESEKPQKWNWTLGEVQYNWFKKELEKSTSRYKFVLAHHTRGQGRGGIKTARAYEWGGYNGDNGNNWEFDTYRPGWELPIHQLMVKHGVNIFFQGHDHLFAKEELDGIVYQEVPMPSDSTYEIGMLANGDAYTGITLNGTGHIRVNISPECIHVDFIRAYLPEDTNTGEHQNGEVAYSYTTGCANGFTEPDEVDSGFKVFPNPAKQQLNFHFSSETDEAKALALVNIQGKIVETFHVPQGQNSGTIETGHLTPGIYFIKLYSDKHLIIKKVVISL